VPDLLHAEPRPWGDLRGSTELVRFAFEGGDCEGVFDELIEAVPLGPSTMSATSLAPQFYLDELFEKLEPGSIALLDELCSGTNPTEGELIFERVVSLLPELGPQVFVSTHFLGLAVRLERERPVPSLTFLQVELDAKEEPTYQFVPGVATTSLAHKVAARLGATRKALEALVVAKRPQ
jgi:DNA mismatch repair protein MutS2